MRYFIKERRLRIMKKRNLLIIAVLILCIALAWVFFSSSQIIGQVNNHKTDEEAIKEVVTSYFEKIKNYHWNNYNKEKGLEFWTEEGKDELLNNPDKLSALEKSIKENKISRKLTEQKITTLNIQDNQAEVKASTFEESTSEDERFNGTVKTYETLKLVKEKDIWRIQKRDAISMTTKTE